MYSFIVLALGLIHWLSIVKRTLIHKRLYSYSRGESIFFGWLEGSSIEIAYNTKLIITNTFITMIIDPLFIAALGLGIMFFLDEWYFGLCIILSGVALCIEEYGVYREQRREVLDVLDGEFRGQQLEEALNKYDHNKEQVGGSIFDRGAVLASVNDVQKMKVFMNQNQGENQAKKGARIG